MLFDPRSFVSEHDERQPGWTYSREHPIARRRPAHDFLTLPSVDLAVPSTARLSFGDEIDMKELVLAQFRAGVIDAEHVSNPLGAGDAFSQSFQAWLKPRLPETKALHFNFALIDRGAAEEEISGTGLDQELSDPLYLAIMLEHENILEIGVDRADSLRALDPSLLYTAMRLLAQASAKSLHIRAPEDFLEMFCRWNWGYELQSDDVAARQWLKDERDIDGEDVLHLLPSVVRPQLAPDDTLPEWQRSDKSHKLRELDQKGLRALASATNDWHSSFCSSLADLQHALAGMGKRSLLKDSQWAEPAYAATSLAFQDCNYIGELLDDHFQCSFNSGDATMFQCFIPFANRTAAIRKQYRLLEETLHLIALLDRVLDHFSE
ncbi:MULTISPECIES: PRTRC system protein F [Cupriavidus]|nr:MULTISPECIES: PRTRC system protein F [Cupriavidus]KAB0599728.1 PRTRC system protein F [Cupriavidus pauculus]MBY4733523.1 PRTRC system protein F [Cupriavidus pauculus]UAL03740.1 PRTRC system protein F [Cupriavidus pauculus]